MHQSLTLRGEKSGLITFVVRNPLHKDVRGPSSVPTLADEVSERCVSVEDMSGEDYGAERGEGEKDEAEDGVDQAEEGGPDAVGYEANGDDQHGEPSHEAGGDHQDSPHGGFGAEDGMGEGEPVGGDTDPVDHACRVEDGQAGGGGDIGGQMLGDGAFVPVPAGAGVGPQGFLDGADKEVEPQRKQDDYADGRKDGLKSRIGQVGKDIVTAEEDQAGRGSGRQRRTRFRRRGCGANRRQSRGGWPAC